MLSRLRCQPTPRMLTFVVHHGATTHPLRRTLVSSSVQPWRIQTPRPPLLRWLSTQKNSLPEETEEEEKDLAPLTTAQKVQVGMNLTLWAAGLSLAGVCAYFIIRELVPTRLSPNAIFDRALDVVRGDERVIRIVGEPVKGYGRDHGGHREGRRNFIENTTYDEPADNSKRVRVRFNVKGPYGEAFVYAEVSNKFKGWVYLMCQDKRSGRVVVLEDNRLTLQAGSNLRSDKERNALANLLGGGPGSSDR